MNIYYLWASIISALIALFYAAWRIRWVNKQEPGTQKMVEIGNAVREGAMAFLSREYRILAVFVLCVALALAIANRGWVRFTAVSFVTGAVFSALAGFIGMWVATSANIRTTNAARKGLPQALKVAFAGGSVMGMSVVGLGLLGLAMLTVIYCHIIPGAAEISVVRSTVLPVITGFSLGASSIALFARVGGGIYTKGADVGADLVGKVEAGIPEDDPRNPATIADNVGDNVGDVAGMGADLFESYVGAIVSAMVLGASIGEFNLVTLPLLISGLGIVISVLSTFLVHTKEGGNPQFALNCGSICASLVLAVFSWFVIRYLVPQTFILGGIIYSNTGIFFAVLAGLIVGIGIGFTAEYYTAENNLPALRVSEAATTGPGTNIIAGLANGMMSTVLPILFICAAVLVAYYCAGIYGIAIGAVGMLGTTGIQLSVDAYGPISDNAGGLAEMAGLESVVRSRTDQLDAVGNTTAAIGKGFAIGSAALTALALFAAYRESVGISVIDLTNPAVTVGLLLGAMYPFMFSAYAMSAVGKAAFAMIGEVRRQFKEIPGLLEGKARAQYARCVDIATTSAIRQMIVPGLVTIAIPVVIGFMPLGGPEMLGGLLAGATASGVMMALFMANAGGAWDNAKKHIENGAFGGKGSAAHKAAVIGDTVGDPFKDTAGPSLNILIKLLSIISLILAPLLVKP